MQTTISAEFLSLMMDGHVACQSRHRHSDCTVEVVALFGACVVNPSRMSCQGAVDRILGVMQSGTKCARCEKKAADCWQIRPI